MFCRFDQYFAFNTDCNLIGWGNNHSPSMILTMAPYTLYTLSHISKQDIFPAIPSATLYLWLLMCVFLNRYQFYYFTELKHNFQKCWFTAFTKLDPTPKRVMVVGCLSISMCVATAQTDRPNGWLGVTWVKLDQLRGEQVWGKLTLGRQGNFFVFESSSYKTSWSF